MVDQQAGGFEENRVEYELVLWNGNSACLPEGPSPDFIVLDLNLDSHEKGLRAAETIPGFSFSNKDRTFVIIWSHFDAEPEFGNFDQPQDDRILRTGWKSVNRLKRKFKKLLTGRLQNEIAWHKKKP